MSVLKAILVLAVFLSVFAPQISYCADDAAGRAALEKAEPVIRRYVNEHRGWNGTDYKVLFDFDYSEKKADNVLSFVVYHYDDEKNAVRGGGKSFLVDFDIVEMKVLREWAFQ